MTILNTTKITEFQPISLKSEQIYIPHLKLQIIFC